MTRTIKRCAVALLLVGAQTATTIRAHAQNVGSSPPTVESLVANVSAVAGNDAPVWLPDNRIVYLNNDDGALWAVSADGGAPARLTTAFVSGEMQPISRANLQLRTSPDGKLLAYTRGVAGGNDIFVWDVAAGAERRVSSISGHVRSFSFSPDSRSIALANDRQGSEDIWVVSVADGRARRLTSDPRYEVFPSWTADGSKIIYTRLDSDWINHDVLTVSPNGGAQTPVLSDKDYFDYRQGGSFGFARVSPDGKWVMFRSQRSGYANYWIAPMAGGAPHQIAAESFDQSDGRWSPDGKQILFLAMNNGTQSLKVVNAAGGAAKTLVAPGTGMVTRAEWSPDGSRVSYTLGTPTTPQDLYVISAAGGTPKQLTWSDKANLASQLIVPEKISWTNDGMTIHAYMWKPKNLQPGERAPVIMNVHGGPTGQFSDNYQLQPQFFASRGYVVIASNVRGSSGYGKKFEDANNRDWGHGDLRDVVAGVEWAKKQPFVNPEKVGITGISYGGMLTMYAISFAPGVFQAAISGSGYGDVREFHTKVPVLQHRQLLNYELGHWPSTPAVDSIYRRSSSILKVADATAPAMLINGYGLDDTDNFYPAFEFTRALLGRAKIAEYKAYPNETYYVYRTDNTRQMLKDMLGFFDRYLKDPSTGTAGTVTAAAGGSGSNR
jgi:dipeptidyl aminopeptidase/acylaminoacyl peptidase